PGLAVVEERRLPPPITPGHAVVPFSEQGPLADPLEEGAEIEPFPRQREIQPVRVPRREIPQIDDITILARVVPVQADIPVAIQVFVPRVSDPDVAGPAAEQLVLLKLALIADQHIKHIAEVRVQRIALTDIAVAQAIGVLAAIVHALV